MNELAAIALPFLLSAAAVLLLGKPVIAFLVAVKARQPVSGDAPATHQAKQGTPIMGGILIIATAFAVTVGLSFRLVADNTYPLQLWAVVGTFLLAGGIGLLDDLGKARGKTNKAGLSERVKLALQVIVAAGFMFVIGKTEQGSVTTGLAFGTHSVDPGIWYYALGVVYICGIGNAANFTDGLDGLLGGVTCIVSLALALAFGFYGRDINLFYGAVAGACAGFLWYNAHPARVFMGDTGSLALGMGLAAAAIASKKEALLLIVGAVYVAEMASMMIQRYVFKYRRIRHGLEYAKTHRVFRRAPLHHHFEELGWAETHVVARFCILTALAAALGLLAARWLSPLGAV